MALAFFAGVQIRLSRKQAKDHNRQLELLRDQTELLVGSRLPKLDVRLESTTEHPYVRACATRGFPPSSSAVSTSFPWPEGSNDPIGHPGPRPFGTPSIDLSTRSDEDPLSERNDKDPDGPPKIAPGKKRCFDVIGGDNVVDCYRKNPSEAPALLAAMAIVGYPPYPSSTLHAAFPVRVYVIPDTGRFDIFTLPGKPLYKGGDREIGA